MNNPIPVTRVLIQQDMRLSPTLMVGQDWDLGFDPNAQPLRDASLILVLTHTERNVASSETTESQLARVHAIAHGDLDVDESLIDDHGAWRLYLEFLEQ